MIIMDLSTYGFKLISDLSEESDEHNIVMRGIDGRYFSETFERHIPKRINNEELRRKVHERCEFGEDLDTRASNFIVKERVTLTHLDCLLKKGED